MKIRKITSIAATLALSFSILATSMPVYASVDENQNVGSNSSATTDVKYSQSSSFFVRVPKIITLDSNKSSSYLVEVDGDIDSLEKVVVVPDESVTMKDLLGNKADVIGNITQDKTEWIYNEMATDGNGNIDASGLTAGSWSGTFNFNIALKGRHVHSSGEAVVENYVKNTHMADGSYDSVIYCESCGDEISRESIVIPKGEHISASPVEENRVEPTCTTAGSYDSVVYCASDLDECGSTTKVELERTTIIIPATHNIVAGECTNCNYKIAGVYDKNGNLLATLTKAQVETNHDYYQPFFSNESYINNITKVILPDNITRIGDNTFTGCLNLSSVNIPNSVTSIGWNAFLGCTSLRDITIPNSVTSINDCAFAECTNLTNVTIPNSVTSIGDGAFYNCTGLTSVTIPNSVKSIGVYAFRECTSLSLTIPNSVTSIGYSAFRNVPHIYYYGTADDEADDNWGALKRN